MSISLRVAHRLAILLISIVIPTSAYAENGAGEATITHTGLPMSFEPNLGQTAAQVRFIGRADGYLLFIGDDEDVIALGAIQAPRGRAPANSLTSTLDPPRAIRIKLLNAASSQKVDASDPLPGRLNYLIGRDPAKWHTNIPIYGTVTQHDVWPGIDRVTYGNAERHVESDFVLAPGADPHRIQLAFSDSDSVTLDPDGNLVIAAGSRRISMLRPGIYEQIGGHRQAIMGRYVIDNAGGETRVSFDIAPYDQQRPLVIDPSTLVYSTYLGGGGFDEATAIDIGFELPPNDGSQPPKEPLFVTGYTKSVDFPAVNDRLFGAEDAFVTKFSADGKSLIYATYIGGTRKTDNTRAFAIHTDGTNAFITGVTDATDFPTTDGAFQQFPPAAGGHPFVTELRANGQSLVFSTYVASPDARSCGPGWPGVDWGNGIAVKATGEVLIVGTTCSLHFPTMRYVLAGDALYVPSAFMSELDRKGHALLVSTYLGGKGETDGNAIALDHIVDSEIFVTGSTAAPDFPVKNAFQAHHRGYSDAFLTKFTNDGTKIVFSTYLGGDGDDDGRAVAVDLDKHAYVFGSSASFTFPYTGGLNPNGISTPGLFVTKFSLDGKSLLWSDSLAWADELSAGAIALLKDAVYVTGTAQGGGFPTVKAFQAGPQGGNDAFFARISEDGKSLTYSTYLGGKGNDEGNGIAVDVYGDVYIAGQTTSHDFPTQDAIQATAPGGSNAFVAKLHIRSSDRPVQP